MTPRVLVAGVGNVFLGDDGFGVEVARRLASQQSRAARVRIMSAREAAPVSELFAAARSDGSGLATTGAATLGADGVAVSVAPQAAR